MGKIVQAQSSWLKAQSKRKMRKYIITIIFALGLGMNLNAQSDGFFTSSYSEYRDVENDWSLNMPLLPGSHGYVDDYSCAEQDVPLGSGLLILGVLALGYFGFKSENLKN